MSIIFKRFLIISVVFVNAIVTSAQINLAVGVFYEGTVEGNNSPSAFGSISFTNSKKISKATKIDKLSGYFFGDEVKDCDLNFYGGWNFKGDLSYSIVENKDGYTVTYSLQKGSLTGKHPKSNTKIIVVVDNQNLNLVRHVGLKSDMFSIDEFACNWNDRGTVEGALLDFVGAASWTRTVPIALKQDSRWQISFRDGLNEWVYPINFPNGACIAENNHSFSIKSQKGSIVINKDKGTLDQCVINYSDAILNISGSGLEQNCEINFSDGSTYTGTLDIANMPTGKLDGVNSLLEALGGERFWDLEITYVNGVSTYANGSKDIWKQGIAEYVATAKAQAQKQIDILTTKLEKDLVRTSKEIAVIVDRMSVRQNQSASQKYLYY